MTGFASPNYTQTPNELYDDLLPLMGLAELKVVLVAIRKTFGYHKDSDEISFSQFMKATGLSRQSVADGIAAAQTRGVLTVVAYGKRGVVRYRLVMEGDQSTQATSTSLLGRPVKASTGLPSRLTKERDSKENDTKEKDSSTAIGALIGEWLKIGKVLEPKAYMNKTYRGYALAMHKAGVTADDLKAFIVDRKTDEFWKTRTIGLKHIAENILTWKEAQDEGAGRDDEDDEEADDDASGEYVPPPENATPIGDLFSAQRATS
jgi:replication protein O